MKKRTCPAFDGKTGDIDSRTLADRRDAGLRARDTATRYTLATSPIDTKAIGEN